VQASTIWARRQSSTRVTESPPPVMVDEPYRHIRQQGIVSVTTDKSVTGGNLLPEETPSAASSSWVHKKAIISPRPTRRPRASVMAHTIIEDAIQSGDIKDVRYAGDGPINLRELFVFSRFTPPMRILSPVESRYSTFSR